MPSHVDSTGGAPRYYLPKERLEFLLRLRCTVPTMSLACGVSQRTIKRRLHAYGLSIRSTYSDISDADLDQSVINLLKGNQAKGPNYIQAAVDVSGHRVQRQRIRAAVQRVDPIGVALRSTAAIKRRTYKVKGPNSLWHIDANLKLIR